MPHLNIINAAAHSPGHNTPPTVEAILLITPGYQVAQWRIRCPYCGCLHHHGAGSIHLGTEERHRMAGHRLSHCCNFDSKGHRFDLSRAAKGYILVWNGRTKTVKK